MKKFLTLILSSLMLLTLGVVNVTPTVYADDTQSTELTFEVGESYTWTIHNAIDFGTSTGTNKQIVIGSNPVSVTKCVLADGNSLKISIAGSGTDGAFTIKNGSTELSYTVSGSTGGNIATGGNVISIASGEDVKTENLTFTLSTASDVEVAGTYKGTVTYTAAVKGPVAEVNGVQYATLDDAVSDANGQTITLLDDATSTGIDTATTNVVIAFDNHTITFVDNSGRVPNSPLTVGYNYLCDSGFDSLNDISTACTVGNTVKQVKSAVFESEPISLDGDITIDLNGKNLYLKTITGTGTVTFKSGIIAYNLID